MRRTRWIELISLLGCLMLFGTWHRLVAQQPRSVVLSRLYTGPDNLSHLGQTQVNMAASGAGAMTSETITVSGAQFVRFSAGHAQDWHNPSHRQYAVILSGKMEVEVSGGQKMLMEPGRAILAEDMAGKGHITRAVGNEDLVFLLVQFPDK